MSMNDRVYLIDEDSYVETVNQRVMLYSCVRQLAFQIARAETIEDFMHLKEISHIFSQQAEQLFDCWDIPGRYLIHGNPDDLEGIKAIELLDDGEEDEEDDDGEVVTFFDAMAELLARSKAVTAEIEDVVAELDANFEPFRHLGGHE